MMVVGLGSFAFHATLRRAAQGMDELPMLWASIALLFNVRLKMHAHATLHTIAASNVCMCGGASARPLQLRMWHSFSLLHLSCTVTRMCMCVFVCTCIACTRIGG